MANSTQETHALHLRLVVVGNDTAGKSCLLRKYTDETFTENYLATIGVDFMVKNLTVDGKAVKLQMWDTAGEERYRTITRSYYRGTNFIMFVYDVTDPKGLSDVKDQWMADVSDSMDDDVTQILVANKCDLIDQRKVPTADGKALADSLQISFHEVSAKTGSGVNELFTAAIRDYIARHSAQSAPERKSPAKPSKLPDKDASSSDIKSSPAVQTKVAAVTSSVPDEPKPYDYLMKALLIGNSGVGKSCILLQYADQSFTDSYIATIGVDFRIATTDIAGNKVKMQLWDTAGQERFRTITSSYYKGAQAIFIVYDVTDPDSFRDVNETWLTEVKRYAGDSVIQLLVANKCDLHDQRKVTTAQGRALAENLGILFFEVSAKSAPSVEEVFNAAAREFIKLNAGTDIGMHKAPASIRPTAPRSRSCTML